ncbi:MAG: hypothetical protein IJ365_00095 [Clostridia bacterium]|nr:hypothetical protein [Clostridia bacterium]
MFNKKEWVKNNLKSGYDKGLWTAEHIMENAMKYSMAGVLDDADLAELAAYTEPVAEEVITPDEIAEDITDTSEPTVDEPTDIVDEDVEITEDGAEDGQADTEVTETTESE